MASKDVVPLPRWPPSLEVSSRPALYQDALPCWGYRRPVRSLPALTDTAVIVANRGRAFAAKRHPPLLASLVYPLSFPTCDGRGPPGGLIQGRRLRAVWPSAVPSRFATHRACGVPEKTKARSFRPSVMGINWRKARTNRKHASFQGETVPSIPINGNLIIYPVG